MKDFIIYSSFFIEVSKASIYIDSNDIMFRIRAKIDLHYVAKLLMDRFYNCGTFIQQEDDGKERIYCQSEKKKEVQQPKKRTGSWEFDKEKKVGQYDTKKSRRCPDSNWEGISPTGFQPDAVTNCATPPSLSVLISESDSSETLESHCSEEKNEQKERMLSDNQKRIEGGAQTRTGKGSLPQVSNLTQ